MNSTSSSIRTASELPTLYTYVEIVESIIEEWDSCVSWAQPPWQGHAIFILCIFMTILYIYTVIMIIRRMVRKIQYRSPFYRCVLILAFGDIVTIVSSAKDGEVQACVISNNPARNLAWEAIGAFCIDNLITVNLVMAVIRIRAVTVVTQAGDKQIQTIIINVLTVIALLWPIILGVLKHNGLVKRIWFPTPDAYTAEFLTPFKELHTPLQLFLLTVTFIIYVAAFLKLMKAKKSYSGITLRRKARILLMASFIFLGELLFLYSSLWIGFNYLNWGSAVFNANLSYIAKPVTSGVTPMIYFIFSREIRHCCFGFLYKKKVKFVQAKASAHRTL